MGEIRYHNEGMIFYFYYFSVQYLLLYTIHKFTLLQSQLPTISGARTHVPLNLLHLFYLVLPRDYQQNFGWGGSHWVNWMPLLHIGLWLWPGETPFPACLQQNHRNFSSMPHSEKRSNSPDNTLTFTYQDADLSAKYEGSISLQVFLSYIFLLSAQTNSWVWKKKFRSILKHV